MDVLNFAESRYYESLVNGEENGFLHHYFEGEYELFDDRKCNLFIFFPYTTNPLQSLSIGVESLREQLRWVISNKNIIIDYLVDNGVIEFAERWMQKKGENETPLQITGDDIRDSLCFDSISVHFEKDMDKPRIDICVVFDPDYCDGCFAILLIDENKKFTYGGIGRNGRRQNEVKV